MLRGLCKWHHVLHSSLYWNFCRTGIFVLLSVAGTKLECHVGFDEFALGLGTRLAAHCTSLALLRKWNRDNSLFNQLHVAFQSSCFVVVLTIPCFAEARHRQLSKLSVCMVLWVCSIHLPFLVAAPFSLRRLSARKACSLLVFRVFAISSFCALFLWYSVIGHKALTGVGCAVEVYWGFGFGFFLDGVFGIVM